MLLVHLLLSFLQPALAENLSWEDWICLSLKFFINKPTGMNRGGEEEGAAGKTERKDERTTHQIRSLGWFFLKVIFIPRTRL